ncbi:hypothetical protein D3C86_2028600 [compost metagenome]
MGHQEQGRFGRQDIGNQQVLPPLVELAGNALGQGGQAHLDAEDVEQVGAQPIVEIVTAMVDIGANALGGGFQRRKMVGVFLEEIGNGVGGEVERLGFA